MRQREGLNNRTFCSSAQYLTLTEILKSMQVGHS